MLAFLKRMFAKPKPIESRAELVAFVDSHAAFVSQKSVTEYCRSKAGVNWDKLMLEKDYLDAINASRWQAYIHVLDDIIVMFEAQLRPLFDGRLEDLANALVALESDVIKSHDIPIVPEGGWSEHLHALKSRIGFLQEGPAHPVQETAKVSGEKVFEVLPIHGRLRHHDHELVVNSVRFLMLGAHTKMLALAEPERIAGLLLPSR